ncbi:hypothetical protein OG21DRAFT_1522147 [Imleria badia]|nr:hypothetical protein OG21DRAFT_1522147 [Imleria badia]
MSSTCTKTTKGSCSCAVDIMVYTHYSHTVFLRLAEPTVPRVQNKNELGSNLTKFLKFRVLYPGHQLEPLHWVARFLHPPIFAVFSSYVLEPFDVRSWGIRFRRGCVDIWDSVAESREADKGNNDGGSGKICKANLGVADKIVARAADANIGEATDLTATAFHTCYVPDPTGNN